MPFITIGSELGMSRKQQKSRYHFPPRKWYRLFCSPGWHSAHGRQHRQATTGGSIRLAPGIALSRALV
ncbi:hypothetical protein J2S90_000015 [Arthrobacter bambusae]|uniref:Uncharacterized protein n=1 Tax=Arthrobacter bambusae TaxID=1338426 RepID=A0AAW8D9V1_9MICC|nr:hypothetical protein [Arthrobacter bambusae]MDQ0128931.1 hypothetical protein [Arthrobacter bambusae]MDQ0180272.1 hypothetical protein [Arthrobacter bambusae]